MEEFRVEDSLDLQRLDVVLSRHPKFSSRSEAQRTIKAGLVYLNQSNQNISPKTKVNTGDLISFALLPEPESEALPVKGDLDIVFEDDHLIVVDKPCGMVVHPSAGHYNDTLVNYLLYHTKLPDTDPIRPGIVHRIDKDTSGLIVVAKNRNAQEHLSQQFFDHTISRKYEALVWGVPELTNGTVDLPIGRHSTDRKKFTVTETGKPSVTHWKLLKDFSYLSLIECRLETGRTHQIRVHMTHLGHSLLGDLMYGRYRNFGKKISVKVTNLLKSYEGQALHAKSLGFNHPETNERMEFSSERPEKFTVLLNALENEFGEV